MTKTTASRLAAPLALAALVALANGPSAQAADPADRTGIGNPAATPAGTPRTQSGVPAPPATNQADRTFVQATSVGGMAEIDFARLAEQRGHSDAVKRFARRMAEDHGKANDRLAALAKAGGVAAPQGLDDEHRAMRAALEQARGEGFDRAYIAGQLADHQKTVQLLEYEIGSGQDPDLKSFAVDTLPTVIEHLRMAQALNAAGTGVPPQAAAPAAPTTHGSGSTVEPPRRQEAAPDQGEARELNRQELRKSADPAQR